MKSMLLRAVNFFILRRLDFGPQYWPILSMPPDIILENKLCFTFIFRWSQVGLCNYSFPVRKP